MWCADRWMPQKSEHTSAFDSASLCNFLCWTAQELHGRLEHGLLAILRSARVQAIARTNVPLGRGIRFTVHYASYVPVMTPRFEAAKDAEDDPCADMRSRNPRHRRPVHAREDGLVVSLPGDVHPGAIGYNIEWTKFGWPRAELNHRHKDFQSSALPTELLGQAVDFTRSALPA